MLLTKKTKVIWNAKNKKHYVDLGYKFTKMKDEFEVDIKDLTKGSQAIVQIKCDYCGKIFESRWDSFNRLKQKDVVNKDCCGDKNCTGKKSQETLLAKYNVKSCRELDWVNEKIKKTNIKKYGVDNVFANEEIKKKITNTLLEKYGVEHVLQNKEIFEKMKKDYEEKHGESFDKLNSGRFVKEKSPRWKGGVEYHRVERATDEYIKWRKGVFSRDLYTCQKCGKRNGNGYAVKLCAHHILNWKDNPNDRYDINNGITLCEDCHIKFHSEYGKRNNDETQLKEFLKK